MQSGLSLDMVLYNARAFDFVWEGFGTGIGVGMVSPLGKQPF